MAIPPLLLSPPVLLGGASALLLIGYLLWQGSTAAVAAPAPAPKPFPLPSVGPIRFNPNLPATLSQSSGLANVAAMQAMGVAR